MSFDDFMLEIIEKIKDHQKGWYYYVPHSVVDYPTSFAKK